MKRFKRWLKRFFCLHKHALKLATITIPPGRVSHGVITITSTGQTIECWFCPECGRGREGVSDWHYPKKEKA